MELANHIYILKNTFNMDINHINEIIPNIEYVNLKPIIDILYCYLDKPEIIYNIFKRYSSYELNIISYLININKLTYLQCYELFNMNVLKIKLIFYFVNLFLASNKEHVNKIYSIFEIFKIIDYKIEIYRL